MRSNSDFHLSYVSILPSCWSWAVSWQKCQSDSAWECMLHLSIALWGWTRQLDHLGATKSCLTTLPWHTQLFFPGPGSDLFHSEHIYTCSLALRLPESQPTWGWAHQTLQHPTHFDDSFMEPRTEGIKSQKSLCPDPCLQDAVFLNCPRWELLIIWKAIKISRFIPKKVDTGKKKREREREWIYVCNKALFLW